MASTTAEVMIYFGTDNRVFESAVTDLRFSQIPEMSTEEILKIVRPIWNVAFQMGYEEGYTLADEE